MQPHSGNQRPDLLTALINMSLVLRLPRKMHLCRSSSIVPRLASFLEMLQIPRVLLTFDTPWSLSPNLQRHLKQFLRKWHLQVLAYQVPWSHAITHPSRWCLSSMLRSWTSCATTNRPSPIGLQVMHQLAAAKTGQSSPSSPQPVRSTLGLSQLSPSRFASTGSRGHC